MIRGFLAFGTSADGAGSLVEVTGYRRPEISLDGGNPLMATVCPIGLTGQGVVSHGAIFDADNRCLMIWRWPRSQQVTLPAEFPEIVLTMQLDETLASIIKLSMSDVPASSIGFVHARPVGSINGEQLLAVTALTARDGQIVAA